MHMRMHKHYEYTYKLIHIHMIMFMFMFMFTTVDTYIDIATYIYTDTDIDTCIDIDTDAYIDVDICDRELPTAEITSRYLISWPAVCRPPAPKTCLLPILILLVLHHILRIHKHIYYIDICVQSDMHILRQIYIYTLIHIHIPKYIHTYRRIYTH